MKGDPQVDWVRRAARSDGALAGGRAPSAWRRGLALEGSKTEFLSRATAWAHDLTRPPDALESLGLWRKALQSAVEQGAQGTSIPRTPSSEKDAFKRSQPARPSTLAEEAPSKRAGKAPRPTAGATRETPRSPVKRASKAPTREKPRKRPARPASPGAAVEDPRKFPPKAPRSTLERLGGVKAAEPRPRKKPHALPGVGPGRPRRRAARTLPPPPSSTSWIEAPARRAAGPLAEAAGAADSSGPAGKAIAQVMRQWALGFGGTRAAARMLLRLQVAAQAEAKGPFPTTSPRAVEEPVETESGLADRPLASAAEPGASESGPKNESATAAPDRAQEPEPPPPAALGERIPLDTRHSSSFARTGPESGLAGEVLSRTAPDEAEEEPRKAQRVATEDLDDLASKIRRILNEEARRHGIDV